MSQTITVFGATGNQGGSVIKEILAHPELSKTYKIKGVTRDASKPAAKDLMSKGVEMIAGNMNDPKSIVAAIKGSDVVFGVTNFWETMSVDDEVSQGKAIVDACKAENVSRLIFSSLPNISKETNGEQTGVHHFDSKAKVEAYAREQGVPGTYFMPGVFMPGFLRSFRKDDKTGDYTFMTGWDPNKTECPFIDPAYDCGLWIAAILLNLDTTLDKRIAAAGDVLTANQMAKAVEEKSGKKANVVQVPWDKYESMLPEKMASELTANMKLIASDAGYFAGEPKDCVQQGWKLLEKSGLRKPLAWKDYVDQNLQV